MNRHYIYIFECSVRHYTQVGLGTSRIGFRNIITANNGLVSNYPASNRLTREVPEWIGIE